MFYENNVCGANTVPEVGISNEYISMISGYISVNGVIYAEFRMPWWYSGGFSRCSYNAPWSHIGCLQGNLRNKGYFTSGLFYPLTCNMG